MDVLGEQRQDFHKTLSEIVKAGQKTQKNQTKQLVCCSLNDGYFVAILSTCMILVIW